MVSLRINAFVFMLEMLIVLAFKLQYVTYDNNWNVILILSFYYSSSGFTHDFYCNIVIYKSLMNLPVK